MNDTLLRLYNLLPSPLRSVPASLRGYYLSAWRYGPETDRMAEETLERDRWSAARWQAWQEEKLAFVLHLAATRVPYYREQWAQRRRKGDRASWEYLENWPILDKESVRGHSEAFLVEGLDIRRLFNDHTSGTTGKPLDIYMSRQVVRANYAMFEARCRRWHGVSRHDRWAILGGQLVTPVSQRRPPFWVWNAGLKQLYCSSYHLAPDLIPHYLDALKRYRIAYMVGYASSLYALAQEALRLGCRDLKFRHVLSNAEPLYDYQRQAISEAFQCPARDTYGMAEIVASATECPHGRYHFWPELGWTEIIECDGDRAAPHGEPGDIVCTGLLNTDMPLIRYRTGDHGTLPVSDTPCTCGRTLPVLASVEGRADDILFTTDGRAIGRLDPMFKARLPIREAQIVQESLERVILRYVPAEGFNQEAAVSLVQRLQARMGPVHVILEPVDRIPRESNGKFRAVVCNLPKRERSLVS